MQGGGGGPILQRTEQRGISLLIKAIAETVKETIVSERMMTSTGIIFTLMKNFQPGGANERTMLLKTLTQPSWGTTVREAAATIERGGDFTRGCQRLEQPHHTLRF